MILKPGQQLAHYRLHEQIGEGGMGVVWKATDTQLNRDAAIKLLPAGFVDEPERLQRFEREARLLASLNHPHIATIHGLHDASGPDGTVRFLAMELVEGEDLAQRIARAAIPLERTIEIATQVAQALEFAHARGVIHRDLKPANIKLTADGQVKVLDFGLAKALTGDPGASDSVPNPAMSPTLTSAGTAAGVILGTAAYMSPEQARGKSVDKRADLWAFGCLVYEMLTAQRVFVGETISDTLASVLKEQPNWSALEDDTPQPLRRMLRRCLAKDPRQRLSDAGAARLELSESLEPPHPDERPGATAALEKPPPAKRTVLPWAVAAVAVLVALGSWILGTDGATTGGQLLNLAIPLPAGVKLDDGQSSNLAVSPDGRYLVFAGGAEDGNRLYLRKMNSAAIAAIPGTDNAINPFFSPDSRWIAFFADGKMKKVQIDGGTPVTICDSLGAPRGASWGADDKIVFPRHFDSALMWVPGTGGKPEPLTTLDEGRQERTHRWPQVVPGHDVVLYTVATRDSPEYYDDARIDALRLSTGERKTVFEGASAAWYTPTGHLVFAREGFLFAVPFDIDKLEVAGAPVPAVEEVMGARNSGAVYASFSETGLLVYVGGIPTTRRRVLTWHYLDGRSEPVAGAEVAGYIDPAVSPDGGRIAVGLANEGNFDIWIYDIARHVSTRLTFEGNNSAPRWTPDGKNIVFHGIRDGVGAVWVKPADGSGEQRVVFSMDGITTAAGSVSPDGRLISVSVFGENKTDIYVASLEDPEEPAVPFVTTPADETHSAFSPDGRWIAYTSDETGNYEVFVRPYPGPGGRWQISSGGGIRPTWSPDGRQLFYRIRRRLYVTDIDGDDDNALRAGASRLLRDDLRRIELATSFGIAPDGQAIVDTDPAEKEVAPDQATVVVSWFEELNRLAPR
jgi:serine/threonine-protein kinase